MSTALRRFAEKAAPLYAMLEAAYKWSKKRTKKSIANLAWQSLGWEPEHFAVFAGLQAQLKNVIETAHRDPALYLDIRIDASDAFWVAAVTQCDVKALKKPFDKTTASANCFLEQSLQRYAEALVNVRKRGVLVVQRFCQLNYLLGCTDDITVFTDQQNLLFAIYQIAVDTSLRRHRVLKVKRWAQYLFFFLCSIEPVPGDLSTMIDIMTRWVRTYRRKFHGTRRVARLPSGTGPSMVPTAPSKLSEWLSRSTIHHSQPSDVKKPKKITKDDDGVLSTDGNVWIPEDTYELKLKFLTVSHSGQAGHCGDEVREAALRKHFVRQGLGTETRVFSVTA